MVAAANTNTLLSLVGIKVDGTAIPQAVHQKICEVEVIGNYYDPHSFILRFYDTPDYAIIDGNTFQIEKEVEILFPPPAGGVPSIPVIKGEITAIEPSYVFLEEAGNAQIMLTVRGYNKLYRLSRGTHIRSFVNVSDSDIVSTIAGEASLSPQASDATQVYEYVAQDNQTNLDFLQQRAERIGHEIFVNDQGQLVFRKRPTSVIVSAEVTWGVDLVSFQPRVSVANDISEVTVKGWDHKTKQAITGTANSTDIKPKIGYTVPTLTPSTRKYIEERVIVETQAEAQTVAKAIMDGFKSELIEAEGIVRGNANIAVGKAVKIKNVGTKFSGEYVVSSVIHHYTPEQGYLTHFRIEGRRPRLISDMAGTTIPTQERWYGIYPAIVTNNKPTGNDASKHKWKIKVKFPWLPTDQGQEMESFWARLLTPMTGNGRGFLFLPEVNDEVLVAFEQGDFNRPYIIGSAYNDQDVPWETLDGQVVSSDGKVDIRAIKTRAGHVLRFTDKQGEEKIEIITAKTKAKIIMEDKSGSEKFSIICEGDVYIEAKKNATLKTTQKTTIDATQDVEIKSAANVKVEGTANVEVKGTGGVKVESPATVDVKGAIVNVKADGVLTVEASGMLKLKGATVMIN